MTNQPLVTIGALNYNNSKYVLKTLDSIANQTYKNIELLIIDDCSTDDSLAKIKSWLVNFKKPYKLIEHEKNLGIHSAYTDVIENASGQFLSILATDDLIVPTKIADQIDVFKNLDESYGVVYGDIIEIDEYGNPIKPPNFEAKKKQFKNWTPPCGDLFKILVEEFIFLIQSALIKTEMVKKFRFNYKAMSEDWQLILFLSRNTKIYGMDKVLAEYRRHSESLSASFFSRSNYSTWCLSHINMYNEAYFFPNNDKEDKKKILKRIKYNLHAYACQQNVKSKEIIETWKLVSSKKIFRNNYIVLFSMYWVKFKFLLRKLLKVNDANLGGVKIKNGANLISNLTFFFYQKKNLLKMVYSKYSLY